MSVSTKLKRRNPHHSIERIEGRRVSSSVSLGRKVLSKAGIKSPQKQSTEVAIPGVLVKESINRPIMKADIR